MKLHHLTEQARAGHIDELNLVSLEGGIYLLEVRVDGQVHLLSDEAGTTLQLRSVEQARQLLQGLPSVPFHLVHSCVHDEICGLPGAARESLRVPLAMTS
ncbi:MAG: DUF6482 family protein [Pseudomonas sp.]|uniref:DUF6482 family protein n=1 Tax=Pseudomonas sp. TaxID=306 RepID=UPI003390A98E